AWSYAGGGEGPAVAGEGSEATESEPLPPRTTLIFIDGTWTQAKQMVARSPWLREFVPRAVIKPTGHSEYKFRKQPEQGCLSTLEAVAEALLCLEGSRGPELKAALTAPFRRMVEVQCGFRGDQVDKNVPLKKPQRLFDAELAKKLLFASCPEYAAAVLSEDTGASDAAISVVAKKTEEEEESTIGVHCVVKWGEKSICRDTIVVETLWSTAGCAKRRGRELSVGQMKGKKCWFLPIAEVPQGSLWELPDDS
ncbi:unnamed protein product, partial [Polarella glacialis]